MYDRAATMEASMVAFMVASWYCYVRAQERPHWAWLAGAGALLAFFTKASAAFFVAALGLEALLAWLNVTRGETPAARRRGLPHAARRWWCAAWLALALFVAAALDRLSLLQLADVRDAEARLRRAVAAGPRHVVPDPARHLHPHVVHAWSSALPRRVGPAGALAPRLAAGAAARAVARGRRRGADPARRRQRTPLPDLRSGAGRPRRPRAGPRTACSCPTRWPCSPRRVALLALPLVFFALYVVIGTARAAAAPLRGRPERSSRGGPGGARHRRCVRQLAERAALRWPRAVDARAPGCWWSALVTAGQLAQFVQWAAGRTYKNYDASLELGRVLPPGTLVHGKLANGLALENRIRPIFVGRGFGNYEDRKTRDDVRYILTYVAPSLGYESQARNPVIQDVLDAYPNHRIIMTFDVAETTTGHDRAALIDKFGSAPAASRA